MYFGGSVVGKAYTSGIGISSTPPPVFAGDQKVQNVIVYHTVWHCIMATSYSLPASGFWLYCATDKVHLPDGPCL